jgi:hypothetical protein
LNGYKEIKAFRHYELLYSIIEHLRLKLQVPMNSSDFELVKKVQTFKMELNSDWNQFKCFLCVDQFDDPFYSLGASERPIWEMLLEYIKTNTDKFV